MSMEYIRSYLTELRKHFLALGTQVAISDRTCFLSYKDLLEGADRVANDLAVRKIMPGDRVCLLASPGTEWAIAFFGILFRGAVIVPLDATMQEEELGRILEHAKPALLIMDKESPQKVEMLGQGLPCYVLGQEDVGEASFDGWADSDQRRLDDVMGIIYTSGTTSTPKGIMLSYRNVLSQVRKVGDFMGYRAGDVSLSVLPLNHMMELTIGFLCPLYVGGRVHFCNSIYPHDILAAAQEQEIAYMVTVPRLLKLMRRVMGGNGARPFGAKIKAIICGGAPLAIEHLDYFRSLGVPVCQGYGMTETSPVISANTPTHNKFGSVGRPYPGIEVKIAEDGEILVRGPNVMKGYFRDEAQTRSILKDGWLYTGDLGKVDDEGFLSIEGRKKDLIVLSSGKKIHPEQLEEHFLQIPYIQEACIVHVDDGKEEGVCLIVSLSEKQNDVKILTDSIITCADSLDGYKRPRWMVVSPEAFPKTHSLKTRRFLVKKWLEKQVMIPLVS